MSRGRRTPSSPAAPSPTGADVLRDREELRPRVGPFLEPGEDLQVVIRASDRPAKALKVAAMEVWPFFAEHDRFLLVATDRRWLVLQSAKERFEGDLSVRGAFDRAIRVESSWVTRFDGFDQPYAIDPLHELWVAAANSAADAAEAGRPWRLEDEIDTLTASGGDPVVDALGQVVMKVGRAIPRRRRRG